MNIDLFLANNKISTAAGVPATGVPETGGETLIPHNGLSNFLEMYGGRQVDDGLFTFHTAASSSVWTNVATQYFPEFKDKVWCLGYDWMGCQFAFSLERENGNYIFDPAIGEVLESPSSLEEFLNEDLVEFKEDTFNVAFFSSLKHLFGDNLPFNKCIGFKVPLFLGGEDEPDNYELTDMEVYWNTNYQLFSQVGYLPDGTEVGDVPNE